MNEREENVLVCLTASVGAYAILHSTKSSKSRRGWVKKWVLERQKKWVYNRTVSDLHLTDREDFRMNTETFQVN